MMIHNGPNRQSDLDNQIDEDAQAACESMRCFSLQSSPVGNNSKGAGTDSQDRMIRTKAQIPITSLIVNTSQMDRLSPSLLAMVSNPPLA